METTLPVNEFQLFNSEGRQVVNRKLAGAQGYFTISLPLLPKGIYYVKLNGVEQKQSGKIIIQ
jgi:hypothetical protein